MLIAFLVFVDRILTGILNGCFCKDRDYVVDPLSKANVHQTEDIKIELKTIMVEGITPARQRELKVALDCVVDARLVYQIADPKFRGQTRHFQSVKLIDLVNTMELNKMAQEKLKLTPGLLNQVLSRLKSLACDDLPGEMQDRIVSYDDMESSAFGANLSGHLEEVEEEQVLSQSLGKTRRRKKAPREKLDKRMSTIKFVLPTEIDTDVSKDWKAHAEGVEVSFSMFLMALQPIFVGRILGKCPRRQVAVQRGRDTSSFAEYMN